MRGVTCGASRKVKEIIVGEKLGGSILTLSLYANWTESVGRKSHPCAKGVAQSDLKKEKKILQKKKKVLGGGKKGAMQSSLKRPSSKGCGWGREGAEKEGTRLAVGREKKEKGL